MHPLFKGNNLSWFLARVLQFSRALRKSVKNRWFPQNISTAFLLQIISPADCCETLKITVPIYPFCLYSLPATWKTYMNSTDSRPLGFLVCSVLTTYAAPVKAGGDSLLEGRKICKRWDISQAAAGVGAARLTAFSTPRPEWQRWGHLLLPESGWLPTRGALFSPRPPVLGEACRQKALRYF